MNRQASQEDMIRGTQRERDKRGDGGGGGGGRGERVCQMGL